jgi:hypothetical protein
MRLAAKNIMVKVAFFFIWFSSFVSQVKAGDSQPFSRGAFFNSPSRADAYCSKSLRVSSSFLGSFVERVFFRAPVSQKYADTLRSICCLTFFIGRNLTLSMFDGSKKAIVSQCFN